RVVDGVVYLRSSPAAKWAKIDLRSVLTGRAAGLSAQTDPAQALAYLAAVSDDVRPVGPDIVRGAATSRYHATLDLARALARSGISQPVRDRLALLEGRFGAARIPLDVWLDPSGRARRIVLTLQLAPLLSSRAAAAVSTGATVGIQEDLFDFGTPVQVTAPPAADVGPAAPGFGLGLLGA
ncbi:MAG TPA: hypothetical protein VN636_12760, partial [Acidimicrobiia bacterium]|nr:hypothetical protein [Acidimicrobiia bacterium]